MRKLILFFVGSLLFCCTYNWVGLSKFPFNELSLGVIEGVQEEPGLESTLKESLRRYFQSKGINIKEAAPLRLEGKIKEEKIDTIAYDPNRLSRQVRVFLKVWFGLLKDEKPLWEAEIGRDKLLNLGEAPILDEEKRRKILSELCDDLSEELYIRLMISLK
jgi:hypothetical protein